jgi:hypothetical protein
MIKMWSIRVLPFASTSTEHALPAASGLGPATSVVFIWLRWQDRARKRPKPAC